MTSRVWTMASLAVAVPSLGAHAQWPAVTPAGDPTVDVDSIVALVVDPAEHRGHNYVLLLDDGIIQLQDDGQTSNTYRQIVQVLTEDGVSTWAEHSYSYQPARQRFRLNWLRTLSPDGTVISDGPDHMQESSRSVDGRSPIYSDEQLVQMTLGGVAPGTLVDASVTIETFAPRLPGDLWAYWAVNQLRPVRRSRFVVDTPQDVALIVREANLTTRVQETRANGRHVRVWADSNLPAVEWQSYAGFPNDVVMSVQIGGDLTWDAIGDWYHQLAGDRYELTAEIESAHDAQLVGAETLQDSLRATYRWVAQDFRYVSLALGDGAYRPRRPLEVLTSGFGDCKDKTTLFVTLARRLGADAYPVLVHTEGGVDSLTPSIRQFDHMIATVERDEGRMYFDLTSNLTPFGQLPPSLHDEVGVVVRDGRGTEVVALPARPPEDNRYDRVVTGSLDRSNRVVGSITFSATGTEQYGLRRDFSDVARKDDDDLAELLRSYALSTVWESAVLDRHQVFEGRDLDATPSVTIWFTSDGVLGDLAGKYLLHLPVISFAYSGAVAELEAEGERQFPIDVAAVNSPSIHSSRLDLELPEGWQADLPDDVEIEGPFGTYRADYRQIGRRLLITREMGGLRGVVPPDSIEALKQWFRSVAEDSDGSITISRGASAGLIASDTSKEAGRLPDILLSPDDVAGATVANEGAVVSDGLMGVSVDGALEVYNRNLAAAQMVFQVGASQLVYLNIGAQSYHTNGEAEKTRRMVELLDLRSLFEANVEALGIPQASIGAVRTLDLTSVNPQASGWVIEVVTPMATLDLAIASVTRGRIALHLMGVGTQGIQEADVAQLFRIMDDRVRADDDYLTDHGPEEWTEDEVVDAAIADSAGGVPLDQIVLTSGDVPGSKVAESTFSRPRGVHTYHRTLDGRAFTFPLPGAEALAVDMKVAQFPDPAHALKAVLLAERQDLNAFVADLLVDEPELIALAAEGDSSSFEPVDADQIGERSIARVGRLRGAFRVDVDAVQFVRGQYGVTVRVSRLPGGSAPGDAVAIARRLSQNLEDVVPAVRDAALSPDLIDRVEAVMVAENEVDSLVDAREFEEMFAAIERAGLSTAPVDFEPETWNSVCWWASLFGYAERAMPACEATVAADTTNLARRDSRAVARALSGDTRGAIADLEYIVDRSPDGPFLEIRSRWLDALRAGDDPFTEEELAELRGDETEGANQ